MFFLLQKLFWQSKSQPAIRWMSLIVVIGLAFGVAVLIVTQAMVSGFESQYTAGLLNFNGHLTIPPEERNDFDQKRLEAIFKTEKVEDQILSVTPYLYKEVLGVYGGKIKGIVLKGVEQTEERFLLGKTLAEELGVHDQPLRLMIPDKSHAGYRFEKIKVGGTFEVGLHEYDSQFGMISLEALQKLFLLPKNYYGFEIKLKDPNQVEKIQSLLSIYLAPFGEVQSWKELHRPLFEALHLERWAFRIVLGLMIVVAGLNLVGLIVLKVFQRKRMQAILRALGLSKRRVATLFRIDALVCGAAGIFLGIVLGLLLVVGLSHYQVIRIDPSIYFISSIPFQLDPGSIFVVAVVSLLLVWLIALLSTKRSLKMGIREGLHGPG